MKDCLTIQDEINNKGKSISQVAREHNLNRRTVRKIASAKLDGTEVRKRNTNRQKTVLTDEAINFVWEILKSEKALHVHKKQLHTAKVIQRRLKEEKNIFISGRSVRRLVHELRDEFKHSQSYLDIDHVLGEAIQIDWGYVDVVINGERIKAYLFVASIPGGGGINYARIYLTKSQEAWGDFIERAYMFFGGIFPILRVDNDSVLISHSHSQKNKRGEETIFCKTLKSHYGIEVSFCNIRKGNEKGNVENGVGYTRRNYLSGLPTSTDLNSINVYIENRCLEQIANEKHYETGERLADLFDIVKKALKPLKERREWCQHSNVRVNSRQYAVVLQKHYSIPETWTGKWLDVKIFSDEVRFYHKGEHVFTHTRLYLKKDRYSILSQHYYKQLIRKKHGIKHSKVFKQILSQLGHPLQEIRNRLLNRYDEDTANQELVKILDLQEKHPQNEFNKVIDLVLDQGGVSAGNIEAILLYQREETSQVDIERISVDSPDIENDFDLNQYSEIEKEPI
ncbi:MAG: IS21 family transposase [Holosporales bacterium]|jgi:transposase|nr:IS21 family transposase [Holosporales bacterium]